MLMVRGTAVEINRREPRVQSRRFWWLWTDDLAVLKVDFPGGRPPTE